jgi:Asp-tRNA(Asn)/Glu-tRNA(Gln) amidotransferase C subunit
MDKEKELEQMVEDMENILNLFKKMEDSSLEDLDTLKKESILLQEKLKERYGEDNSTQTNPPQA